MTRGTAGSPAAGAPAAGDRARACYVYGVVPAAQVRDWSAPPGVGDPPGAVRAVAEHDLAALLSDVEPGFTAGTRGDLEGHERVLSGAAATMTVIPMRFGVVMDGDEAVRESLLRRHAERLAELLEQLDGHVQMTLKAFYAEDVLLREVIRAHPEIARAQAAIRGRPQEATRNERIAIGEMVAAGVARQREADERRLVERVAGVAARVLVEPPANDRTALNAQLLVHRDRRAALDALVGELVEANAGRLALRYVGPIAPYSFADVELEA
jgi:hypothetical protein